MDREQTVKALECCASSSLEDCDNCPIDKQKKDNCECGRYLAIQALALIRERTEENERLRAELDRTEKALIALDRAHNALFTETFRIEAQAKADTVRKMQERLKENLVGVSDDLKSFLEWYIDQIAKELLEEQE